ncbi:YicC family protein [Zavarzinia aquatilis]|uniref:YicC family protein n=2 Tax=Zavarzinia aquatilis TaxID=2211142 RepID=A0A317EA26_9PROT|nr:YicC family protein [Zavarzinia aquatilis]
MTGFARVSGPLGQGECIFEVKSVNGRGLEIRMRLPNGFERLERALRDVAGKRLKRGNLQIQMNVLGGETVAPPRIDGETLRQYLDLARDLAAANGLEAPRIEALMSLPGVIARAESSRDADEEEGQDAACIALFEQAVEALHGARAAEGRHLEAALATHLDDIERLTGAAEAQAATQPAALRDRLSAQLADLLKDKAGQVSAERLAQEVALLAVKADVREEIDRLRAHVAEARKLLKQGDGVGRRLDFLAQEFNREANTLCSKSTDVELTRLGLDLKTSVDRLREQVQNVE